MKHLFLVLMSLALLSCNKTNGQVEKPSVTSNELKKMVSYLSSDEIKGRNTGTEGIDKAAAFIENKFKAFNVKPYYKTYRDSFTVKGKQAFNVIGFIEGTDKKLKDEIIILGAHYDHIGFGKKVGNDSIANGANDNATGTSAVIAMAKYFSKVKSNRRSIMFALFSAEELGLEGSKHLAERLKESDANIYTVVNFEMIGVPLIDTKHQAFLTGYELSNMGEKMNSYAKKDLIGASDVSKKYNLFMRSDNYAFYKAFKVPSHTLSSCDLTNFDHYHQVGDEVELLDFSFMAGLVNATIPTIEAMSNTPTQEIKMYE
ncbi:M28 family peptidase [Mangrovimonas spongiae]|uniref:M28 family peptidase n=1 Tax=Mangrovimonas spongiae TaxID=2494697 RepID=A0A3R9MTV9_9FLAO|nr:M28 family peptidase [Mangrovimonas spongiae]RSK40642.1 M28 family peptidase [Mangrovimonas spongiae]